MLIYKENWQRLLNSDAHIYLRPTYFGRQDNLILISDGEYNSKNRYIVRVPDGVDDILNNTYDARYNSNIAIKLRKIKGSEDLYTYLDNSWLRLSRGMRVNINTTPKDIRDVGLKEMI